RASAGGFAARSLAVPAATNPELQLHPVAAGRRADHAGADGFVRLVERADVARVLIMIDDLVAVCHVQTPSVQPCFLRGFNAPPIGQSLDQPLPYTFPKAARAAS